MARFRFPNKVKDKFDLLNKLTNWQEDESRLSESEDVMSDDRHADEYTNEQPLQKNQVEYILCDSLAQKLDPDEKEYALILSLVPTDRTKERRPITTVPPWDTPEVFVRCKREILLDLIRRIEYVLQAK